MGADSVIRSFAKEDTLTCFACDAPVDTKWRQHTFTYGEGPSATELTVNIPVRTCRSCGFEFLDHEAEGLMHEAVCTYLGVLSPKEIRGIRGSYRMSRTAFAEVTGFGEATLNRWENGLKIQTLANDRYLRLLGRPENMQRLKSLGSAAQTASSDPNPSGGKFRMIHVSDGVRREQGAFRLRLAA